jgi:glutaminyl-peptide cyclotransferase
MPRGGGGKDGINGGADEHHSEEDNSSHSADSTIRRSRIVMWGLAGIVGIAVLSVAVPLLVRNRQSTSPSIASTTTTTTSGPTPRPSQQNPQQQPYSPSTTTIGRYELLETVPHDPAAFTQGLGLLNETHAYESTGLHGQSSVRVVRIADGQVLRQHSLSSDYFGEGLTLYRNPETGRNELVQITWQERTGFVYDAATLKVLRTFRYDTSTGEGWGITTRTGGNDGTTTTTSTSGALSFLVSDGSHYLATWDASFAEVSRVAVTMVLPRQESASPQTLRLLNELEHDPHTDTVLANVWVKDWVVRINATSGSVVALYDLADLYPPSERDAGTDVLNGIAATRDKGVVWVTGKLWPHMYRIRLVDP